MVEISAKLVKELRDKTDAGIMECKNALKECAGDIEKAVEFLKQKGLSKADKKADRIAAEGVIAIKISDDLKKGSIIEINSETDFVAKNDNFRALVGKIIDLVFENELSRIEELSPLKIDGIPFDEYLKQHIATIGENIIVRRISTIKTTDNEVVNGYLHHNQKVGALCLISYQNGDGLESKIKLAKDLSIHIASMKPKVLDFSSFSLDFIDGEKQSIIAQIEKENEDLARLGKPLHKIPEYISRLEITDEVLSAKKEELQNDLKAQNKPEKIWDKIIPGQIDRFVSDNTILDKRLTLLSQDYALDDSKNVEGFLMQRSQELNDKISIVSFLCFNLGEGIEKKVDNFAEEVAAQMK